MSDFWNSAAKDAGQPLTRELLEESFAAIEREYEESLTAPYTCPHKLVILPREYARTLNGKPCPWGCGQTLVTFP